jgi:hypothetical protein
MRELRHKTTITEEWIEEGEEEEAYAATQDAQGKGLASVLVLERTGGADTAAGAANNRNIEWGKKRDVEVGEYTDKNVENGRFEEERTDVDKEIESDDKQTTKQSVREFNIRSPEELSLSSLLRVDAHAPLSLVPDPLVHPALRAVTAATVVLSPNSSRMHVHPPLSTDTNSCTYDDHNIVQVLSDGSLRIGTFIFQPTVLFLWCFSCVHA